jgi:hypothetical protein
VTRDEYQRAISDWHAEWAAKWSTSVTPDDRWSGNDPSQYPEGIVDLSAPQEAIDEYWAHARDIQDEFRRSNGLKPLPR